MPQNGPDLHPIQLDFVGVKRLHIDALIPPNIDQGERAEESARVRTYYTVGEDDDRGRIWVGIVVEVGTEEGGEEHPYALNVEIMGQFIADFNRFPEDRIEHWARFNAPLVLFPYLREHVYGLTSRCGFQPLILPLVEVPSFQIAQPQEESQHEDQASTQEE